MPATSWREKTPTFLQTEILSPAFVSMPVVNSSSGHYTNHRYIKHIYVLFLEASTLSLYC